MNWIDWTPTVLGTLCFLMLSVLMKGGGGKGGGGKGAALSAGGGSKKVTPSWVLKTALAFMGGVFLTFSIVGVILRSGLAYLPTIVIGGAMAFALFVWAVDVFRDRNANKPAVIAMAMVPLLLVAAAGPIANVGGNGITEIYNGTTTHVGPWLGG